MDERTLLTTLNRREKQLREAATPLPQLSSENVGFSAPTTPTKPCPTAHQVLMLVTDGMDGMALFSILSKAGYNLTKGESDDRVQQLVSNQSVTVERTGPANKFTIHLTRIGNAIINAGKKSRSSEG